MARGSQVPFIRHINAFKFTMPDGQDFSVTTGPDSAVAAFTAQQAIEGLLRAHAIDGISGIQFVDQHFFVPIRASLAEVQLAEWRSDSAGARSAATQALAELNQLKSENHYKRIGFLLHNTGPNKPIGDLSNAFFEYATNLEQSVNNAQAVPAQIDAYIKSNVSGIRLFQAAQVYQGGRYRRGLQCSDLLIRASSNAGSYPTTTPLDGNTMTKTWFVHGMGPEFRQIVGGNSGVPLGQLAGDWNSGKIALPIGSVIVSDGHAALFSGIVKVGPTWELITYDANDESGWTVSLDGTPSTDDPDDKMLSFPGHQVGQHVTRLQWGVMRLVKVFQPIGNHGADTDSDPQFIHRDGRELHPRF